MRPSRTVARAALTAVLALVAVPGLVGSHEPNQDRPIDAAAFGQIFLATTPDRQDTGDIVFDAAGQSDGVLGALQPFADLGSGQAAAPDDRAQPRVHAPSAVSIWKQPLYSLSGYASFYDYGTTAMRDVPRGTTIVICGAGGCIERIVTDYGPSKAGGRLIDMYRPDFFAICGCGSWSGTTQVTVRVY